MTEWMYLELSIRAHRKWKQMTHNLECLWHFAEPTVNDSRDFDDKNNVISLYYIPILYAYVPSINVVYCE